MSSAIIYYKGLREFSIGTEEEVTRASVEAIFGGNDGKERILSKNQERKRKNSQ
jgi:hypothetical protein